MITRQDYLKNSELHDAYYTEIAKDIGIKPDKKMIEKAKKALENGDLHLNSIPLKKWDIWAFSVLGFNYERVYDAFKKRNDYPTLSGLVCTLKAITRYYVTKEA